MSDWSRDIGAHTGAEPAWHGGVPFCASDGCRQYDGKRCRLLGQRPGSICEPVVVEMSRLLDTYEATP